MAQGRSERSQEFLARALKITPGGAQTRSKRAQTFPDNFPVALQSGIGAYVWDIEDRKYLDWICGLGAISLGYGYEPVEEATMRQHWRGVSFSLPHRLEIEVSELLVDVLRKHGLPSIEQVRWVKTGSEATVGAMMVARRYTKRDLILSIGYHGWHEAHQPFDRLAQQSNSRLWDCKWGDLNDLERYFTKIGYPPVAGVLIEACRDQEPPKDYLQCIREFCCHHGALMIMDECVTGFRWAIGGASEYFGVEPDIAVYGKGLANGYPLACLVGPRDILSYAIDVSGTYGGEAMSLAACGATLQVYLKEPVIQHMWDVGQVWTDSGLAEGYPCHPRLKGSKEEVFEKVRTLASGGVLVHPAGFNVSYSHSIKDARDSIAILQ